MMTFPIYGEIKFKFQITNQFWRLFRILWDLRMDSEGLHGDLVENKHFDMQNYWELTSRQIGLRGIELAKLFYG